MAPLDSTVFSYSDQLSHVLPLISNDVMTSFGCKPVLVFGIIFLGQALRGGLLSHRTQGHC